MAPPRFRVFDHDTGKYIDIRQLDQHIDHGKRVMMTPP